MLRPPQHSRSVDDKLTTTMDKASVQALHEWRFSLHAPPSQNAQVIHRIRYVCSVLGLRHFLGLIVLLAYVAAGAGLFMALEDPNQEVAAAKKLEMLARKRTEFVNSLLPKLVNNSRFLFFADLQKSLDVASFLEEEYASYEAAVSCPYTDQRLPSWSFLNSVFYAVSLLTTIGTSHMILSTSYARLATVVYATIGLPLVVFCIFDLAKLLATALRGFCRCTTDVAKALLMKFHRGSKATHQQLKKVISSRKNNAAIDKASITKFSLAVGLLLLLAWLVLGIVNLSYCQPEWLLSDVIYLLGTNFYTIGVSEPIPQPDCSALVLFHVFIAFIMVASCIYIVIEPLNGSAKIQSQDRFTDLEALSTIASDFTTGYAASGALGKPSASVQTLVSIPTFRTLQLDATGQVHILSGVVYDNKSGDDIRRLFRSYEDMSQVYGSDYLVEDLRPLRSFSYVTADDDVLMCSEPYAQCVLNETRRFSSKYDA